MTILDQAAQLFGNHYRLALHLKLSPSTVYRWRDGVCEIPETVALMLKGYVEHPERVGQDIATRIKEAN